MTEDEATTKWCPMTRYRTVQVGEETRGMSNHSDGSGYCVGSECMAWRWIRIPNEASTESSFGDRTVDVPAKEGDGFCGLVR